MTSYNLQLWYPTIKMKRNAVQALSVCRLTLIPIILLPNVLDKSVMDASFYL